MKPTGIASPTLDVRDYRRIKPLTPPPAIPPLTIDNPSFETVWASDTAGVDLALADDEATLGMQTTASNTADPTHNETIYQSVTGTMLAGEFYTLQYRVGNDGSGYFDPLVEILVGNSLATAIALEQYTDKLMPTPEVVSFEL